MSALSPGASLCDGRYRLDDVLGRGGMAMVWRATDLQLERTVAIKVISDVLASDPAFVTRFEREARLAASLNHPNLVKLFDFSAEDGRPLLVMEYVDGGTLAERRGPVDPNALARQLLDALAHIHAAGVVHRDVKPANVLMGSDGRPRLTDFGIARGEDQTGLTLTGQVMGTVRYIAPEVASGGPSTARSDLYSLGVLLGEYLGGAEADPALRDVVARMSNEDPDRRPASAADALADLTPTRSTFQTNEVQNFHSVEQTAVLDAPRAPRRPRPSPSSLLWPAVAALALGLVFILSNRGGSDDSPKPKPKPATQTVRPAPADAPLDAQLTRLEQMVQAAPRR